MGSSAHLLTDCLSFRTCRPLVHPCHVTCIHCANPVAASTQSVAALVRILSSSVAVSLLVTSAESIIRRLPTQNLIKDAPVPIYIGRSDVAESVVTIRSPFCGYNTTLCVGLKGGDLSRYSNKTEPVSLRKCPYDHRLTSKSYLSTITVKTFIIILPTRWRQNQLACIWNNYNVTVTLCIHRVIVKQFRSISMPAGFRRHLVGKTISNVCYCDVA